MADDGYFSIDKEFKTDSPFQISSSRFLNDPMLRHHFIEACFRRNHPDVPSYVDNTLITPAAMKHMFDQADEIEELFVREAEINPKLAAWLEARHYDDLSMEKLVTYPHGSVGNLLYRFCDANGYKSELGGTRANTHFGYFMSRVGQQHDLEHFFGGFGFDYIGEQGAVWLRHAAYFRYLSPALAGKLNIIYMIISMAHMTRTMAHYPEAMEKYWDVVSDAVRVGRASEPVFMMNYDSALHLPIPEARKALGWRETTDRDSAAEALIWAEGLKAALDPRSDQDLAAQAA